MPINFGGSPVYYTKPEGDEPPPPPRDTPAARRLARLAELLRKYAGYGDHPWGEPITYEQGGEWVARVYGHHRRGATEDEAVEAAVARAVAACPEGLSRIERQRTQSIAAHAALMTRLEREEGEIRHLAEELEEL